MNKPKSSTECAPAPAPAPVSEATESDLVREAFLNLHNLAFKYEAEYVKVMNNPKASKKKKNNLFVKIATIRNALYATAEIVPRERAEKIPGLTLYLDHT